jgi:DNA polymerase family B, exonuclease domain.
MNVPQTTKDDITDEDTISIAAQVLQHRTFDDGNTQVQLQDIEGQEFLLKIWDGDLPDFEFRENEWILLEDALGDIYNENVNVGSNYGDLQVTYLESSPSSVDQDEPDDTATDSTQQTGGVVALDIETISTVPEAEFEFDNSDHLELLCIGVGYAPYQGAPGTSRTLFRSGTTDVSEAALLQQFCEYVESHTPSHLVTFKGDFDYQHLIGRAERLSEIEPDLSTRVRSLFTEQDWTNLDPWGSLEDNADVNKTHWDIYDHSLTPAEWRKDTPGSMAIQTTPSSTT